MHISRRELLRLGAAAGIGAWTTARPAPAFAAHPSPSHPQSVGASPGSTRLNELDLQRLLERLSKQYDLPGAVVGVSVNGRATTAAAGIANLNTGALMTPDTAFLTGSITKVWTTSMVMTFVDDGTIDLYTPVIEYLPHVRFRDARATREVTTWHLLNHSSGIDAGDYILDLGEGPEAHRRYVELLANVGQIHPPGAYLSYCNAGFILAGHLVETITGQSWAELLRERIIEPLGLRRTVTSAAAAILRRTAVGSLPDPERPGEYMATPRFLLPESAAPAGSTLITTVEDNLAFARMHMRGGVAEDGTRVLSENSVRAMATRTIDRPSGPAGGFALGWSQSLRGGATKLAHSGGSNGGLAQLVALPQANVAYAAFTNSSLGFGFLNELQQRILDELVPLPAPPSTAARRTQPSASNVDRSAFVGTFRRMTVATTVREVRGRLMVEVKEIPEEAPGTEAYSIGQPTEYEVVPVDAQTLRSIEPVTYGLYATMFFLEPDTRGKYQLMYSSGRLARRLGRR